MKLLFAFTIFLFLGGYGWSQNLSVQIQYVTQLENSESANWIFYQPNKKLILSNFKMEPDEGNPAIAITMSGFAFKAKFKNLDGVGNLQINVYCNFDMQKSWMKPQGQNAAVLNHEQKHFDLTYLYCLRFLKQLQTLKFSEANYKRLLLDTHKAYINALAKKQAEYDSETGNGVAMAQQILWNDKIANWIMNEKMN